MSVCFLRQATQIASTSSLEFIPDLIKHVNIVSEDHIWDPQLSELMPLNPRDVCTFYANSACQHSIFELPEVQLLVQNQPVPVIVLF
jgi:hypothetical protein